MTPTSQNVSSLAERISQATSFIHNEIPLELERRGKLVRSFVGSIPTAVVLGSGLGAFAERLDDAVRLPYAHIPGFPVSTVEGHAGALWLGSLHGAPIVVMQGRVHFYEGHDLATVTFPIRVLLALGAQTLVLTNAAGGLNPAYRPGDLVAISDHLNLLSANPLTGPNAAEFGPRFPDMTQVYAKDLRELAIARAKSQGMNLREGVYAACPGPSYETPAEVRMLRTLGADLVGMSTVPEAIVARHQGARVLGISCVTNLAAGLGDSALDHSEVTATADRVRTQFSDLLSGILADIAGVRA